MQSETELQSKVIKHLEALCYLVLRFNNVGFKGHTVRRKGISDLIVCTPSGRFMAIELKRLEGKLRPEQKEFLKDVEAHKGIPLVIKTLKEIEEFTIGL